MLGSPSIGLIIIYARTSDRFRCTGHTLRTKGGILIRGPFAPALTRTGRLFTLTGDGKLAIAPCRGHHFSSYFLATGGTVRDNGLKRVIRIRDRFSCCHPITRAGPKLPRSNTFCNLNIRAVSRVVSLFNHPSRITCSVHDLHGGTGPSSAFRTRLFCNSLGTVIGADRLIGVSCPGFVIRNGGNSFVGCNVSRRRADLGTGVVPNRPKFTTSSSINILRCIGSRNIAIERRVGPRVNSCKHICSTLCRAVARNTPGCIGRSRILAGLRVLRHKFRRTSPSAMALTGWI